jgi:hypothetical protein
VPGASSVEKAATDRHDELTERKQEVPQLTGEGRMSKEITEGPERERIRTGKRTEATESKVRLHVSLRIPLFRP